MEVKQIYELMNSVTNELLGKTEIITEDLSNVVDVGTEIFNNVEVDAYVKTLVNKVGKTIFVTRNYTGNLPKILMDNWEYGSVLEKIQADLPETYENETWELENNRSYDTNVFYKPSVSAKFFNKKVTFEIPMSFTELQVKQSFTSATQLNGFLSMLYNSVETAMTIKIDSLIMRTINSMIGETLFKDLLIIDDTNFDDTEIVYTNTGNRAVNLLALYNTLFNKTLTPSDALTNGDFIKYSVYVMNLYADRLTKISTLFNIGEKERFTNKSDIHTVLLSEYKASCQTYLQADTFNPNLLSLPNADIVPYWQGTGTDYSFENTSKIDIEIGTFKTTLKGSEKTFKKEISTSGIIGVMFDRNALGVTNLDRRVTTNYNAKAEFYNNYYKFDCGYFNDLNENFIVFFIA